MRTFICNIVPNNLVAELKVSQAANNFCFNLIDHNCFDSSFSIVPTSWYHNDIKNAKNITYFSGKSNYSKVHRFLCLVFYNILCAWKARKSEHIWFYNICFPNIICFIILSFLFKKQCNVILLDYTPCNSKFSIQYLILSLIRHANGVIALSQRMSLLHKNIAFKAGVIASNKIRDIKCDESHKNKLVFLFSGNLSKHTGFPLALEVFKDMPQSTLLISGPGNIDVNELSNYPNINYLGYLDYQEYLKMYDKVDVCLSFRNPAFPENEYNFPSKILEYFCLGKIVISTIEYPEIAGFKYLHCDYNKNAIIKVIKELQNMDLHTFNAYKDNREMLKQEFSVDSWIQTIIKIENREK